MKTLFYLFTTEVAEGIKSHYADKIIENTMTVGDWTKMKEYLKTARSRLKSQDKAKADAAKQAERNAIK